MAAPRAGRAKACRSLGGFLFALVVLPQTALRLAGVPLLPGVLQAATFFLAPFVAAGLLGMAAETLDGDTGIERLAETGRERYLPLLLADLLEFAVFAVFWLVLVVAGLTVVFVVEFGAAAAGFGTGAPPAGGDPGGALLGAVGVLGVALAVLAVAVPLLLAVVQVFIQFFPVAVVVEEVGAVEGFRRSVGLVRRNLAAVLGFSLVNGLLHALVGLPVAAYAVLRLLDCLRRLGMPPGSGPGGGGGAGTEPARALAGSLLPLPEVVGLALASLALRTLVTTASATYATAFYTRVRGLRLR